MNNTIPTRSVFERIREAFDILGGEQVISLKACQELEVRSDCTYNQAHLTFKRMRDVGLVDVKPLDFKTRLVKYGISEKGLEFLHKTEGNIDKYDVFWREFFVKKEK